VHSNTIHHVAASSQLLKQTLLEGGELKKVGAIGRLECGGTCCSNSGRVVESSGSFCERLVR
jgi:hypothetical protein